jgi:hypothetical protein
MDDGESLRNVVDYLDLKETRNLQTTCKQIKFVVDNDIVYRRFANRRFPKNILDVSSYGESWKALLRDKNARNTIFGKIFPRSFHYHVQKVILNDRARFLLGTPFKFYGIVWDRSKREIGFIVSPVASLRVGVQFPFGHCFISRSNYNSHGCLKLLNEKGKGTIMNELQSLVTRSSTIAEKGFYEDQIRSVQSDNVMVFVMGEIFFTVNDWLNFLCKVFSKKIESSIPMTQDEFFLNYAPSSNMTRGLNELCGEDAPVSTINAQENALTEIAVLLGRAQGRNA